MYCFLVCLPSIYLTTVSDEVDTAVAETTAKSSTRRCKCNRECDEDDEESHTIIRYKNLTITIYGKISIGNNLISLSKYEVSY